MGSVKPVPGRDSNGAGREPSVAAVGEGPESGLGLWAKSALT